MQDCIFCQVVVGKLPSYKIYEDELFYAFLDIFPKSKGHILVVPKKHYKWTYDIPEFGKYWETAHRLTKAVQKAMNPYFISYLTYGLDVPHAHIHIIPYYREVSPTEAITLKENLSKQELAEIASKIRQSL